MVQAPSTSEVTNGGLSALRSAPTTFLERDAAQDGLSRPLVWTLFWLPLVTLTGLLALAGLRRLGKMLRRRRRARAVPAE